VRRRRVHFDDRGVRRDREPSLIGLYRGRSADQIQAAAARDVGAVFGVARKQRAVTKACCRLAWIHAAVHLHQLGRAGQLGCERDQQGFCVGLFFAANGFGEPTWLLRARVGERRLRAEPDVHASGSETPIVIFDFCE
jgi:hypothetical protein